MTRRLVYSARETELTEDLRADTIALRILGSFITAGALSRLLALKLETLQVITRFDLADFTNCGSDIAALRKVHLVTNIQPCAGH